MSKQVHAIFRLGSHGWVHVTHKADRAEAEKRLERFEKDMPHEKFRLDMVTIHK